MLVSNFMPAIINKFFSKPFLIPRHKNKKSEWSGNMTPTNLIKKQKLAGWEGSGGMKKKTFQADIMTGIEGGTKNIYIYKLHILI